MIANMDVPDTTITQETTTTFVDDGNIGTVTMSTARETKYNSEKDDIAAFLSKPRRQTTITWTTTSQPANTQLAAWNFGTHFLNVTDVKNKWYGFGLIRGTFCIKVTLNAMPFQQGRLLLHFLPTVTGRDSFTATRNINLASKTQQPNIELDARQTSVTMKIPYVTPYDYLLAPANTYDFGSFFLSVLSPLKTGSAGSVSADITAYLWMEDVELAAPMVGNSKFSAESEEADTMAKTGSVSAGLRKISIAAGALSDIPVISEYAKTTAWAATRLAKAASAFGFSKPRTDKPQDVFVRQDFRHSATSDGVDVSIPLTILQNNEVKILNDVSIRNEDEMSINFLKKVQMYVTSLNWSDATAVDTALIGGALGINYMNMRTATPVVGKTLYTDTSHPFLYLSKFCKYYRGSMKLTLKFIKTPMHTGRLKITWVPNWAAAPGNGEDFCLREIVDIRYCDEITLELPWFQPTPFLDVTSNYGYISISVLNKLRAPSSTTVAGNIDILVYASMSDDAELAVPIPGNVLVPVMVGNSNLDNAPIGGESEKPFLVHPSEVAIGESICTIKDFTNRFTLIRDNLGNAITGNKDITIAPFQTFAYTTVLGVATYPSYGGDALSMMAPMYNLWRGSVRIGLKPNVGDTNASVKTAFLTSGPSTFLGQTTVYDSTVDWTTAVSSTYGQGIAAPSTFAAFQVPFYCPTRTVLVTPNTTDSATPSGYPTHNLRVGPYSTQSPSVYRATGDDFQFSYFLGTPPVFFSLV